MPNLPIADKATVDAILALLGIANPITADTDTIMNYLKKIFDKPVSPIKSIQSGSVSITTATTTNVTISAVDINKSIVIISSDCKYDVNTSGFAGSGAKAVLTSTTNLAIANTAVCASGSSVAWQVIEFN